VTVLISGSKFEVCEHFSQLPGPARHLGSCLYHVMGVALVEELQVLTQSRALSRLVLGMVALHRLEATPAWKWSWAQLQGQGMHTTPAPQRSFGESEDEALDHGERIGRCSTVLWQWRQRSRSLDWRAKGRSRVKDA
jgi:hypothetical protein